MASKPKTIECGDGAGPTAGTRCDVDDELDDLLCRPVDDLDRELEEMAESIVAGELDDDRRLCTGHFRQSIIDDGRPMAILSYFSVMFGIPVFLAPLVLRDNVFSLHHARAAGAIFLLCTAFFVLALVNCAVFLPLVFVCYIPALIGVYRASAGVEAGTSALGPAGDKLFGWIEVKE